MKYKTKSVRISPEAYDYVLNYAAKLQMKWKKKVSFIMALDELLLSSK